MTANKYDGETNFYARMLPGGPAGVVHEEAQTS
jgi:hypothetical protein